MLNLKTITGATLATAALAIGALSYTPYVQTYDLVTYDDIGTPAMVQRAITVKADCRERLASYAGRVARVECVPSQMTLARTGL